MGAALFAGLAMISGAALAGRSGRRAITSGSQAQAERELYYRTVDFRKAVQAWEDYLPFGATHGLPATDKGCSKSRRLYLQALDEMKEARSALRHPRVASFYRGSPSTTMNAAIQNFDFAFRSLVSLRNIHNGACSARYALPSIPLSGLR